MRISKLRAPGLLAFFYIVSTSFFTPATAQIEKSATATSLFKRLARSQTRELVVGPGFTSIDANGDGFLSLEELEAGQLMTWPTLEAANRARKVFGVPSIEEFFQEHDTNADGLLSRSELRPPLEQMPVEEGQCTAVKSKLDSCAQTSSLLRCTGYTKTAEAMCRVGHDNVVQQCILNSECGDICKCIRRAERSVHDNSLFVVQPPQGHPYAVTGYSNSTALSNAHEKRGFWLLGFLIVALIQAIEITGIALEQLAQNIIIDSVNEARFMDFKIWSTGDNPPACSVYLYWSHSCGAILSHSARTCSNSGTRVYGNSCKDHFRYGSRGCGFLDFGCQSLCYGINEQGCPCSYFSYSQQNDVDYPGGDLKGMNVQVTSDCRTACSNTGSCVAFETLPPNGDPNQQNCLLKSALGSPQQSTGTTSFIKLGHSSTCPSNSDAAEWGLWDKRDDVLSVAPLEGLDSLLYPDIAVSPNPANALELRQSGSGNNLPAGAFPFNQRAATAFTVIVNFLTALYAIGQAGWLNQEPTTADPQYGPLTQAPLGADTLTYVAPDTGTHLRSIGNLANPRWAASEMIWRVINTFRAVTYTAAMNPNSAPIATFLQNQNIGSNALSTALFPADLVSLLTANEGQITASTQWVGRGATPNTAGVQPFPNVNIAHAGGRPSNLQYYQRGAAGPFSLEAAFLLSSQIAGINWRTVFQSRQTAARQPNPPAMPPYYFGILAPPEQGGGNGGMCIWGEDSANAPRQLGFAFRPPSGNARGDGRSGFYIAIEIDYDLAYNQDPNRNLFVFVVHSIDPNSAVYVPDPTQLTQLRLTPYPPPPPNIARNPIYDVGATGQPPLGPAQGTAARIFAHAHGTFLRYSDLSAFLNQDPSSGNLNSFPGYTPIGTVHYYILTETESNTWPRAAYRNTDNSGPGHDEL